MGDIKIKYSCKLEQYYHTDKNKFDKELKNFIGFIVRKYMYGLKQTSEVYFELRSRAEMQVYDKLISGEFDSKRGRFDSYVFTQIRGEINKFANKYNRERKFSDIAECSHLSSDEGVGDQKRMLDLIDQIVREYSLKNIDSREIIYFILNSDKATKKCDFVLRFITYEFTSRYYGTIHYNSIKELV